MSAKKNSVITDILRILARQGTWATLLEIQKKESMRYNDVLKYLLANDIIKSRSVVNIILNDLTSYDLLVRKIIDVKPLGSCYCLTKKGIEVIDYLSKMEKLKKK